MTWVVQFDLSGPEGGDYPPNINISTSLYRFSGLDQKLFTFTVSALLVGAITGQWYMLHSLQWTWGKGTGLARPDWS